MEGTAPQPLPQVEGTGVQSSRHMEGNGIQPWQSPLDTAAMQRYTGKLQAAGLGPGAVSIQCPLGQVASLHKLLVCGSIVLSRLHCNQPLLSCTAMSPNGGHSMPFLAFRNLAVCAVAESQPNISKLCVMTRTIWTPRLDCTRAVHCSGPTRINGLFRCGHPAICSHVQSRLLCYSNDTCKKRRKVPTLNSACPPNIQCWLPNMACLPCCRCCCSPERPPDLPCS